MLESYPANPGRLAIDERLEKIVVPEGLHEQHVVQASYSMVDIIGHVNNTRYIEWAADCFTLDDYSRNELDSIQINYAAEVKPGERVSIQSATEDDRTYVIAGINLNTGARAFEVVWVWK
jgi:acyl-ACP thioesterase